MCLIILHMVVRQLKSLRTPVIEDESQWRTEQQAVRTHQKYLEDSQ
jgi:hypothetical protein